MKINSRAIRLREIQLFFLFLFLFALMTRTGISSWNDASRMATIESLVDYRSFMIDNSIFFEKTGDKYLYNGHFYSDKPPMLALYGSIIYFLLQKFFHLSFINNAQITYYFITVLTVGVISSLALVYFFKILVEFLKIEINWSIFVTFIVGVGTLIFPYSIVFNNHAFSGSLILISFYYLLKGKKTPRFLLLSGLLMSLAGSIDITCFIFLPLCFIVLRERKTTSNIFFLASSLPIIVIYFCLNMYTSGSWMPPAMNSRLWDYPGSYFNSETLAGLANFDNFSASLWYGFNMILGGRGLFLHTPLLLFSAYGFFKIFKRKKFEYKTEFLYLVTCAVCFILLYCLRTTNYSGCGYPVRWFASLMLILSLPLAYVSYDIRKSKLMQKCFIIITSFSMMIALLGTYSPFMCPFKRNPLIPSFIVAIMRIADESSIRYKLRLIFTSFIVFFLVYRFLKQLNQQEQISNLN